VDDNKSRLTSWTLAPMAYVSNEQKFSSAIGLGEIRHSLGFNRFMPTDAIEGGRGLWRPAYVTAFYGRASFGTRRGDFLLFEAFIRTVGKRRRLAWLIGSSISIESGVLADGKSWTGLERR